MNDDSDSDNRFGCGCLGTALVVLVMLKLTGELNRGWWYVTAPLWVPVAAVSLICAAIMLWSIVATLLRKRP